MKGGMLLGAVLASLVFPGFGQGLSYRQYRMLAWALAAIATAFAILWSVAFVIVTVVVRLAAAIDAFFVLKQQATPGHRVYAAIAVVIGAIGLGYIRLALEVFQIPSSSMSPTLVIGDHVYVDKLSTRWTPIERGEVVVFMQPCAQRPYIKRVIAVGGDTVEVRCSVTYVNGSAIDSKLVAAHDEYRELMESDGTWFARASSRYRETYGGRSYHVFHDAERPARDSGTRTDAGSSGDRHDFPSRDRPFPPACHQSDYYEPKPGTQQPAGKLVETKRDAAPCEPQLHFAVPPRSFFVMGDNRDNANDSRYWGVVPTDAVIGRAIGIWRTEGQGWSRFGAVR